MPAVGMVRGAEAAAALLQPVRLKVLECLAEPDSATGLAKKLGLPRQKLNYHLKELEKHGLVEVVEERRKGNCIERIVRATARSYLISPEVLGRLGATPEAAQDRFSSSYLVAVSAQAIRDVAHLREKAAAANKKIATLTLQTEVVFGSAEERNAFGEELANALARLTARYHREDAEHGRRFRFFLGGYPVPPKEEAATPGETPAPEEKSS